MHIITILSLEPPKQYANKTADRLAPPKSSLYPYSKGQVMEKLYRWKKDETPETDLIQQWRNLVF